MHLHSKSSSLQVISLDLTHGLSKKRSAVPFGHFLLYTYRLTTPRRTELEQVVSGLDYSHPPYSPDLANFDLSHKKVPVEGHIIPLSSREWPKNTGLSGTGMFGHNGLVHRHRRCIQHGGKPFEKVRCKLRGMTYGISDVTLLTFLRVMGRMTCLCLTMHSSVICY